MKWYKIEELKEKHLGNPAWIWAEGKLWLGDVPEIREELKLRDIFFMPIEVPRFFPNTGSMKRVSKT